MAHPARMFRTFGLVLIATLGCTFLGSSAHAEGPTLPHPILFVTQVPIPDDFATIGSTFANHMPSMDQAGRGGDLWIRYEDGTLRNLTEAAGYGVSGFQDEQAIAVREPSVHWDGAKALFSMVVGAPDQYQYETYHWQIYEITGLGPSETPVITKVTNQPLYNNVSPIYGTDDRILFTSDRPITGEVHHYPQLDEYESTPTVTGIWSLDPTSGDLFLLQHSPSGSFSLEVDSFGRVVFTRWDHLQRDQQADADATGYGDYGTFNWSSEAVDAVPLESRDEVFPEPRPSREDLLEGTNLEGHTFNHFFPWTIFEDGREEEVLGHAGRHELHAYFNRSLNDDPNLQEFIGNGDDAVLNFFHIMESPVDPGLYYGIDAPEFQTHSAGQVIRLRAAPTTDRESFSVEYVTDRSTSGVANDPPPEHSGLYRNPVVLAGGQLAVVHTSETRADDNEGTRSAPVSRYDFRLKLLVPDGDVFVAGDALTPGITKSISYYDPDVLVFYNGDLWELDPVEVRSRTRPIPAEASLPAPEAQVFQQEGISVSEMESFLVENDLALIVARDVTTRDDSDVQQPFNLQVPGGTATIGGAGTVYDVSHMQIFEAKLIRGMGGTENPDDGRRVLAQPMNVSENPMNIGGPLGSTAIALDGSAAAFVPARRALSWQTTEADGTPVVRERYWITFQPGEIRSCTSCHGLNDLDQAGNPAPSNEPEALRSLLQFWKEMTASTEPGRAHEPFGLASHSFAPAPFRGDTTVRFSLAEPAESVALEVYSADGRPAGTLDLGPRATGEHRQEWDGTFALAAPGNGSRSLSAGVYFTRLVVDGRTFPSVKLLRLE